MSSDARKRAEEALASSLVTLSHKPRYADLFDEVSNLRDALRALLASEPAKAPFVSRNEEWGLRPDFTTAGVTAPPAGAEVARLTAILRECNAVCLCGCPESEHESYGEDGESCGNDDHECLRVAPAVLEIVQRYRVALSNALAQKPAGAEVREAAERLETWLPRLRDTRRRVSDAARVRYDEMDDPFRVLLEEHLTNVVYVVSNVSRLLAALRAAASPAPGSEGVREAEEPSEAERLLRVTCERLIGVPVAEQSRSLADISLAIDAALLRLRGE